MERILKYMFDDAIQIELSACDIYKVFAKKFSHVFDVSNLWHSMALDEIRHAEILKETRDSLGPDVLNSKADNMVWENIYRMKKNLKGIDTENITNLHEAIETSHLIEASEVNSIFKFLNLEYFTTPLREAFIESEIMDHQRKLVDFSMRYNTKSEREAIVAFND